MLNDAQTKWVSEQTKKLMDISNNGNVSENNYNATEAFILSCSIKSKSMWKEVVKTLLNALLNNANESNIDMILDLSISCLCKPLIKECKMSIASEKEKYDQSMYYIYRIGQCSGKRRNEIENSLIDYYKNL